MKLRLVVLTLAVLIAWGLKRHYSDARAEDLVWILGPTASAAGVMTGTTFVPEPGEGYLSRERMFVIEKACAGVNFLIAAFAMLVVTLRHRVASARSGACVLGVSLLAGYLAAVLVNAVRITIAMWLAAHPPALWLSAGDVHRLEGVIVYFGGLFLLYELVQRIDGRDVPWLPLAAYYGVALGLPLLNGAAGAEAFIGHALVVLFVPLVLIVVWSASGAAVRSLVLGRADVAGSRTYCAPACHAVACGSPLPASSPRRLCARPRCRRSGRDA